MGIFEILSLILGGGGIGSFITYLVHLKSEKRIKEAQATKEEISAEDRQGILERDRFEAMYVQINKMIEDYNTLDDDYRLYRKDAAERERIFASKVSAKCEQLASLKSQIQYLKGLRCYNTSCKFRIKTNPEKPE